MKKSGSKKNKKKKTGHNINQPVQDHSAELKAVDAELLLKIDELKEAEKKAQFLSLIAEQISDAVITTGLDYRINYVNEEKFRLLYENLPLGYQSLDLQGNFIIVNLDYQSFISNNNS